MSNNSFFFSGFMIGAILTLFISRMVQDSVLREGWTFNWSKNEYYKIIPITATEKDIIAKGN